jgi:hypothetical protein
MSDHPDGDPHPDEALQELLAAYEGVVPPELFEQMRAFLADSLATHPVAATLLDRVRPRAVPFKSGDTAKPGREAEAAEDKDPSRGETG